MALMRVQVRMDSADHKGMSAHNTNVSDAVCGGGLQDRPLRVLRAASTASDPTRFGIGFLGESDKVSRVVLLREQTESLHTLGFSFEEVLTVKYDKTAYNILHDILIKQLKGVRDEMRISQDIPEDILIKSPKAAGIPQEVVNRQIGEFRRKGLVTIGDESELIVTQEGLRLYFEWGRHKSGTEKPYLGVYVEKGSMIDNNYKVGGIWIQLQEVARKSIPKEEAAYVAALNKLSDEWLAFLRRHVPI